VHRSAGDPCVAQPARDFRPPSRYSTKWAYGARVAVAAPRGSALSGVRSPILSSERSIKTYGSVLQLRPCGVRFDGGISCGLRLEAIELVVRQSESGSIMSKSTIRAVVRGLFSQFGYTIYRTPTAESWPPDMDTQAVALFRRVRPFTMTTIERVYALRESVKYIIRQNIPGSIVECGVWKGGSMMAVAKTLSEINSKRDLYLFDTFEGMTTPTTVDVDFRGVRADDLLMTNPRTSSIAPFEEVSRNMLSVGYDPSHIKFVRGKVEDTLPAQAPSEIALLRLDTDWYESTHHELIHLYPRLAKGGILIVDSDFSQSNRLHWSTSSEAAINP
jgi:O-methyltransferase